MTWTETETETKAETETETKTEAENTLFNQSPHTHTYKCFLGSDSPCIE